MSLFKRVECAFCGIDDKDPRVLNAGKTIVSFLVDPDNMPGHALVIPRRHIIPTYGMAGNEMLELYTEAHRLKIILGGLATGVSVWEEYQEYIPEDTDDTISHFRINVAPASCTNTKPENEALSCGERPQTFTEEKRNKIIELLPINRSKI